MKMVSNTAKTGAGRAIAAYIAAFQNLDSDALAASAGQNGLVEVPLIKPSRLFGRSEIRRGHSAAFQEIVKAEFVSDKPIAESDDAAIWLGTLNIQRNKSAPESHEIGIVAQPGDEGASRISLYFNSRGIRRWADETIL